MAGRKKMHTHAVVVELSEADEQWLRQKAEEAKRDFQDYLSGAASTMIAEVLDGSILIPAARVKAMERNAGRQLDVNAIVELIHEAIRHTDSGLVIRFVLDGAYESSLKELCRIAGKSVDQYIRDSFHTFMMRRDYTRYGDQVSPILFTKKQLKELKELTGVQYPSGEDVLEAMRPAVETEA